ncbi:DUF362 domain-containing protein [Haloplasma contractile]|nr:DUF362 domain-containing protein [Haloplasma contractile]
MIKYKEQDVAITHNDEEVKAVEEGLKLIKAKTIFQKDDVVVITPNWVHAEGPNDQSRGEVVGKETLRFIIKWVKKQDPKRIVVATGSGGGNSRDIMKKVGYEDVMRDEEIEFIDYNEGPYDTLTIGHKLIPSLKINKILSEKTKLISFTQLKQHEESTMSAAIKNVTMSIPSTEEHGTPKKETGIHDDLHGFITKMASHTKIDLSIVSANPAMVGTGPNKGTGVHTGLVICGNNPVSTDTIGARLLGFKPQAIQYLYELEKLQQGETDINKMNLKGIGLKKAEQIFTEKVYGKKIAID